MARRTESRRRHNTANAAARHTRPARQPPANAVRRNQLVAFPRERLTSAPDPTSTRDHGGGRLLGGLVPAVPMMDPVIAALAAERPDVRFITLDVDANQKTAADYGVLATPTLLVFRGGQEVLRLVGARPKRRLVQELAPVLVDGARG
jgi:hypothetical protein